MLPMQRIKSFHPSDHYNQKDRPCFENVHVDPQIGDLVTLIPKRKSEYESRVWEQPYFITEVPKKCVTRESIPEVDYRKDFKICRMGNETMADPYTLKYRWDWLLPYSLAKEKLRRGQLVRLSKDPSRSGVLLSSEEHWYRGYLLYTTANVAWDTGTMTWTDDLDTFLKPAVGIHHLKELEATDWRGYIREDGTVHEILSGCDRVQRSYKDYPDIRIEDDMDMSQKDAIWGECRQGNYIPKTPSEWLYHVVQGHKQFHVYLGLLLAHADQQFINTWNESWLEHR